MHAYEHRGGDREAVGFLHKPTTVPEHSNNLASRGEPLAKLWPQGSERPNPPPHTHAYSYRGGGRDTIVAKFKRVTGPEIFENW